MEQKRTGLIMEGGAMRGMFTCGVIDVFLEHDVTFDGAIGVSAGAVFGCNYKSRQIGRAVRYNKKYGKDKRFGSFWSLLTTGDYYGADFCYRRIPYELDLWDEEAYEDNPMEFYVTCTDVETGKAVYRKLDFVDHNGLEWVRASASMPMMSRVVHVDGYHLLDGGVADSIPLEYFQSIGFNRNVVILTQPEGYVKGPNPLMPLAKVLLRKYPNLIEAFGNRHIRYNAETEYVAQQEQLGNTMVIRPPQALGISRTEKKPEEIERVYQIGRQVGKQYLERVKAFLQENQCRI